MSARAPLRAGLFGCACALAVGCLPAAFDALADAAPVRTIALSFPGDPAAELALALTVPGDDEGRGRVLFGDGERALGWMRVDLDGRVDLRFAHYAELLELGGGSEPRLTNLAVVEGGPVAEGLVRVAASESLADRVVRFRVADFSRIAMIEDDMFLYPWVGDPAVIPTPTLEGPLAAIQLDDGLPEGISASSDGVWIWDALGSSRASYEAARNAALTDDPGAFDADPSQGWALTHCADLHPSALAGGALLADERKVALALSGDAITMIAAFEPPQLSLIGAPIYDCAAATLSLPAAASSIAVVDLGLDGDDDLLVGSAAQREVWVYENLGAGIPDTPSLVLEGEGDEQAFAASLTAVELGGDAPEVIVVGAPDTEVDGHVGVGRVLVYDAADGELLKVIEDLEPRTNSHHGLGVHGVDVPGREELVVSGAPELRVHWSILVDDEGPLRQ